MLAINCSLKEFFWAVLLIIIPWVGKLQPSAGRAVVSTASRDGRTFYRVRVIDLPDRAAADRVARELATRHALPKLWVGKE